MPGGGVSAARGGDGTRTGRDILFNAGAAASSKSQINPLLKAAARIRANNDKPVASRLVWLRVAVVFVSSGLCSSVLVAFPAFESVLIDQRPSQGAGLFAGSCGANASAGFNASDLIWACEAQYQASRALYSISLGMSVTFTLLTGYLYDTRGPKFAAVLGALGCAVGNVLITVSLMRPEWNWLVYVAMSLTDCAGSLASFALYGFVWLCWRHQGLIAALYMSSVGLSAYMAELIVWLVRGPLQVSPHRVWLILAAIALVSALISWFACVDRDEFHRHASAVTEVPSSPTRAPLYRAVRDVLRAWRVHPVHNSVFFVYTVVSYCFIGAWSAVFAQLVQVTLTLSEASQMLSMFALIGGLGGGLSQPLLGWLYDRIGLRLYMPLVVGFLLANVLLISSTTIEGQYGNLVMATIGQYSWATVLMRWNLYFVPPALSGSAVGVQMAVSGLTQMLVVTQLGSIGALLGATTDAGAITRPLMLLGSAAAACGLVVCVVLGLKRMPASPPQLPPEGEKRASSLSKGLLQ